MKVIDFGSGDPLCVMNNWCGPDAGGPLFIQQPCIADILGGGSHEIHCYDRVRISKSNIENPRNSDAGRVLLHANKRTLPRSVDIICALNPDPVSIFEGRVSYSFPKPRQAHYIAYPLGLALMVDIRLRVGGLLAVQFDECVKPPMDVPYDGTQRFLDKVLSNVQSRLELLHCLDSSSKDSELTRFYGAYSFSSLHIFQRK